MEPPPANSSYSTASKRLSPANCLAFTQSTTAFLPLQLPETVVLWALSPPIATLMLLMVSLFFVLKLCHQSTLPSVCCPRNALSHAEVSVWKCWQVNHFCEQLGQEPNCSSERSARKQVWLYFHARVLMLICRRAQPKVLRTTVSAQAKRLLCLYRFPREKRIV